MDNNALLNDFEQNKPSSKLNVLTILTIIGSLLAIVTSIYSFFTSCANVAKTQQAAAMLDNKMFDKLAETAQLQCDNRVVLLILALVCSAICLFGALQMRQLKKIGLYIYTAGELLYPVATTFILGFSMSLLFMGFIFPIAFVILYFTCQKELTK